MTGNNTIDGAPQAAHAMPLTSMERELQAAALLPTEHGRVLSVSRLTPNVLEVTLSGFAGYPLDGGDEFVYVMVSHEPGGISPGYGMDNYRDQAADDSVLGVPAARLLMTGYWRCQDA